MGAANAMRVFPFEDRSVRAFLFRSRPCWIAQEIGAAVGYTREGFDKALRNWSDELIVGKDLATLRGADLREFKLLSDVEVSLTSSRAPSLTILFEPGLHLVSLKTDKPLGKKLRRWLADVVMPGLLRGTLEPSNAERELVSLTLRLSAGDADSIWELETVQELCRLHRKPIWDGTSRMAPWLRGPMGAIYRIVLGDAVFAELKLRNPTPHDGSLNYQFLTEARHKLMRNDMGTVMAMLRTSRTAKDFYQRLRFAYRRTAALQTAW